MGPNWIVIYVGLTSIEFKVSNVDGEEVFSGSEPIGSLNNPADAARAATRASMVAAMYAGAHGGVEGYEIIGL